MGLFLTMNGLKNFKSGTKNLKFAKNKCNISNQHPRIYQNTKFHEKTFFAKNTVFRYHWAAV